MANVIVVNILFARNKLAVSIIGVSEAWPVVRYAQPAVPNDIRMTGALLERVDIREGPPSMIVEVVRASLGHLGEQARQREQLLVLSQDRGRVTRRFEQSSGILAAVVLAIKFLQLFEPSWQQGGRISKREDFDRCG